MILGFLVFIGVFTLSRITCKDLWLVNCGLPEKGAQLAFLIELLECIFLLLLFLLFLQSYICLGSSKAAWIDGIVCFLPKFSLKLGRWWRLVFVGVVVEGVDADVNLHVYVYAIVLFVVTTSKDVEFVIVVMQDEFFRTFIFETPGRKAYLWRW